MFRGVLLTSAFLLTMGGGSAQMNDESARAALRGLTSIALVVEGIDEEARRCGITQSLIRDAFLFPASQSKIEISENATGPGPKFWAQVNVTIQERPDQCISSVSLAAINYQMVKLDYTDEPTAWVIVRPWNTNWVIVGRSAFEPHAQRVRAAVENSTKKFLTAWNFANKL